MSDVFGAGQAVSGVAQAAGSVAAATIQAGAVKHAADQQAEAARNSLDYQQRTTTINQQLQRPFIDYGTNALAAQQEASNDLPSIIDPLIKEQQANTPTNVKTMDEATLRATPGFQFNLNQGLQATQNAAAARGLGVSGAALKGAATYATGLADSTYQNQFSNAQTQFANSQTRYADLTSNINTALAAQNQQFNQRASLVQTGENAATGSGAQGQAGAANATNILSGLGNAQAGASIAGGNAIASGINGITNSISQNNALAAYNNNGSVYGGSGDSAAYTASQNRTSADAYGPGY